MTVVIGGRRILTMLRVKPVAGVMLLLLVAACVPQPDGTGVAGTWNYDWQVREDLHYHGEMTLEQDGADVTGSLGFPAEADPSLKSGWRWQVCGVLGADGLRMFSPDPAGATSQMWKFHLLVNDTDMAGPSWSGNVPKWTFSATR